MNHYHPTINPRAYSTERLEKRRDELVRVGIGGTKQERTSTQRKVELAAINIELKHRNQTLS